MTLWHTANNMYLICRWNSKPAAFVHHYNHHSDTKQNIHHQERLSQYRDYFSWSAFNHSGGSDNIHSWWETSDIICAKYFICPCLHFYGKAFHTSSHSTITTVITNNQRTSTDTQSTTDRVNTEVTTSKKTSAPEVSQTSPITSEYINLSFLWMAVVFHTTNTMSPFCRWNSRTASFVYTQNDHYHQRHNQYGGFSSAVFNSKCGTNWEHSWWGIFMY